MVSSCFGTAVRPAIGVRDALAFHGALRADLISGVIEQSAIGWEAKIERIHTGVKGGHGGGDEKMAASLLRTMLDGEPPRPPSRRVSVPPFRHSAVDQACDEGRVVDLRFLWKKAVIVPEEVIVRPNPPLTLVSAKLT